MNGFLFKLLSSVIYIHRFLTMATVYLIEGQTYHFCTSSRMKTKSQSKEFFTVRLIPHECCMAGPGKLFQTNYRNPDLSSSRPSH